MLVVATKVSAPALAKALSASLPSAALGSVRALIERAAQTPAEELESLMAEVKAIALTKEARSHAGEAP